MAVDIFVMQPLSCLRRLRFKLDVDFTSRGEIVGLDLRVRDMQTRQSKSLGGISGSVSHLNRESRIKPVDILGPNQTRG